MTPGRPHLAFGSWPVRTAAGATDDGPSQAYRALISGLAGFGIVVALTVIGASLTLAMAPSRLDIVPGDAHSYWGAWAGGLYQPGGLVWHTDYLYSPAFAQLFYPLTLVPWPLFAAAWTTAAFAVYVWLLRPLSRGLLVAGLVFVLVVELPAGNIEWLLALVCVYALRYPAGWALPLLTKVTPGVGLAWHVGRREWRHVAVALAATGLIAGVSFLLAPALWADWFGALSLNAHAGATDVAMVGLLPMPPLIIRAPLAGLLALWGGATGRVWTLPLSLVLAEPDMNLNTLGILAAVPRLRQWSDRDQRPDREPHQMVHVVRSAAGHAEPDIASR